MKCKWESSILDDVCISISGLWTGKKEPFTRIGVLRNTNFTKDCHLNFSDIAYIDVESKALEKKTLCIGDIIIEKSGGGPRQPVGRAVLFAGAKEPFSFSNFTSALRIRDSLKKDICPEFLQKYLLWFYLSGQTEPMQKFATGIRNLDMKQYLKINFSYPPLSEQKRIVGILDAAFEKIDKIQRNAERNLANAKELFQQVLDEEMTPKHGWNSAKIKSFSDIKIGPFGSLLHKSDYVEKGVPIINPCHMRNNVLDEHISQQISRAKAKELSSYTLQENDIVFARRGDIGRCALISSHEAGYLCGTGSLFVRIKNIILPSFLFLLAQNSLFISSLNKTSTGTTISSINVDSISEMEISFPSIDKQKSVLKMLSIVQKKCQEIKSNNVQLMEICSELKQQILTKAFNGEL